MDYPDHHDKQLIRAFNSLKTPLELQNFLRDLLTLSEIKEAANRFRIATLLWQGEKSYQQIARECNTSTTTVTRVNEWLNKRSEGGYRTALSRLYPKKS